MTPDLINALSNVTPVGVACLALFGMYRLAARFLERLVTTLDAINKRLTSIEIAVFRGGLTAKGPGVLGGEAA